MIRLSIGGVQYWLRRLEEVPPTERGAADRLAEEIRRAHGQVTRRQATAAAAQFVDAPAAVLTQLTRAELKLIFAAVHLHLQGVNP